jgi:hypothetical protein
MEKQSPASAFAAITVEAIIAALIYPIFTKLQIEYGVIVHSSNAICRFGAGIISPVRKASGRWLKNSLKMAKKSLPWEEVLES